MKFVVANSLALLGILATSDAKCPNLCNGHGKCVGINKCECYGAWTGGDCSLRKCPMGKAWADVAINDDNAHNLAECSNQGSCNYQTGQCECFPGYEGLACNRMICPGDCNANGKCKSMREYANSADLGLVALPGPFTQAKSPYKYNLWDADMMYGCACDMGYEGWQCTQRKCPKGDDPMTTDQADEVQLMRCDIDPTDPTYAGDQFTLSYRGAVTRPFSPTATAADIKSRLEELPTIQHVQVTYTNNAVTFCDATYLSGSSNALTQPSSGNVVSVTFLTEHGDLPRLVVLDQHAKPLYGPKDNLIMTAAKEDSLVYTTNLSPVTTKTVQSVIGEKEDAVCSNRGTCDEKSGVCKCFTGFTASDGAGRKGNTPDCGYAYLPITSCPGKFIECSGHGTCSGHPSYKCTCHDGWMGGDCSIRQCPMGKAWFDYPTADNTAHQLTECSNKGECDRESGKCKCQAMFEGQACERMTCPGKTSPLGVCSGHGRCLTMAELAGEAKVNGDPSPFTYGSDPNEITTWDGYSVYGCACDEGYTGFDCSQRTCPYGDDMTLVEADPDALDEVQTLQCNTLDGSANPYFRLSFRGKETVNIPYNAPASVVKAALEDLTTVEKIDIEYSNTANGNTGPDAFCDVLPLGNTVTFRFRTAHGDVPPLRVVLDESTRDPYTKIYSQGVGWTSMQLEFIGGDVTTDYSTAFTYSGPSYPTTGLRSQEHRKGKTTWKECSNRGVCDRDTGICQCFLGFGSSNNERAAGDIENCGYRLPYVFPKSSNIRGHESRTTTVNHNL